MSEKEKGNMLRHVGDTRINEFGYYEDLKGERPRGK